MNAPTEFTPAWAIETYLTVRNAQQDDEKEFNKRSAERAEQMGLLENFLLQIMLDRGEEQIRTSAGTAYKSPQMRVKMVDRHAVILNVIKKLLFWMPDNEFDAIIGSGDLSMFDIFTNHVSKDYVKEQLDNNVQPPGIEITQFTACNVRKA
jgi:hypothetical protein